MLTEDSSRAVRELPRWMRWLFALDAPGSRLTFNMYWTDQTVNPRR